jgi:hypothetical protein
LKSITDKELTEALNHIAALPEGQLVLAYLKDWCGYGKDKTRPRMEDTFANAATERVYINLRRMIRAEYLKKIEFDYQRKAELNGTTASTTRAKRNKPDAV